MVSYKPPPEVSTESGEVTCTGPLETAMTFPNLEPTALVIDIPRSLASTIACARSAGRSVAKLET